MNLARTWRPKTFDEIVGQELTVRILKNSLYRNQIFPVYLLSGQRGCGKTTTGRVFAAALNCARRDDFCKNPQGVVLPCLECYSCKAMSSGNHPDFIEIDAASHTGVDNVRALIDASALLPILGTQKIYLIDEAHMLSKAAFNAFLKILEEPSANVIFMLATTDPHKILDTVKSRCFHLFFDQIDQHILREYLVAICKKEQIPYDEAGLIALIQKAEGSARDALNILERVRLAVEIVDEASVRGVLGIVDVGYVIRLLQIIVKGALPDLFQFLSDEKIQKYAASDIWEHMRAVIRECIWRTQKCSQGLEEHAAEISALAAKTSVQRWVLFLELLYETELAFNKASVQHDVLQLVFIKMMQSDQKTHDSGKSAKEVPVPTGLETKRVLNERVQEVSSPLQAPVASDAPWSSFLQKLSIGDPLLFSLFKQANVRSQDSGILRVEFPLKLQFFKDKFVETKAFWQPLLEQCYGQALTLVPSFTGHDAQQAPREIKKLLDTREVPVQKAASQQPVIAGEKAQMITSIFPGTLQEIKEN